MPKHSGVEKTDQPRSGRGNQPAIRSGAWGLQWWGREAGCDNATGNKAEAVCMRERELRQGRSQPRHMCGSVTAMITTAFIERCLGVLMHAACGLIDIVKRVPGKGPRGAVSDQRKDEYGCDNASQHWRTGLGSIHLKLVQTLAGFHSRSTDFLWFPVEKSYPLSVRENGRFSRPTLLPLNTS
jgi:hypothetical protein